MLLAMEPRAYYRAIGGHEEVPGAVPGVLVGYGGRGIVWGVAFRFGRFQGAVTACRMLKMHGTEMRRLRSCFPKQESIENCLTMLCH